MIRPERPAQDQDCGWDKDGAEAALNQLRNAFQVSIEISPALREDNSAVRAADLEQTRTTYERSSARPR
jgi:hypothetical protein